MEYRESMLKVDGLWRYLLVVVADDPQEFGETVERVVGIGDDREITYIYFIDELYKHEEKDGKHYYWLLYSNVYHDGLAEAELADALKEVIEE